MKTLFLLFSVNLAYCNQRIIGGSNVSASQYAFMAAVYKHTPEGDYFCGGTLLGSQWIITAGQCVDGATLFTIYLGTKNIKTPDSTSQEFATEEYVLHPDYNSLTLENDIGLIKLRMPVVFSSYILPMSLSTMAPENIKPNVAVRALGWGQTNDVNAGLSDHLQSVSLTTISNEECKITYGSQITDNMLCVSGNYNEGSCHGDTGSPLLTFFQGHKAIHEGISSFVSGNGCESTDPSGYTRTYPYVEWMKNVTGY